MIVMHKYKFPIETPEAIAFWGSRHKCNRMKAIIAFSEDLADANKNLRNAGYRLFWRIRALNNFGMYVNDPGMTSIPFSEKEPWWVCMPYEPGGLPREDVLWLDEAVWVDTVRWTEK